MSVKSITVFAAELANAYSTANYQRGWGPCIKMLRKRGYTDVQIEVIIRSKWPRWAADSSSKAYGRNTANDLARFLDNPRNFSKGVEKAVEELVRENA